MSSYNEHVKQIRLFTIRCCRQILRKMFLTLSRIRVSDDDLFFNVSFSRNLSVDLEFFFRREVALIGGTGQVGGGEVSRVRVERLAGLSDAGAGVLQLKF